jgi:hypothetical protein
MGASFDPGQKDQRESLTLADLGDGFDEFCVIRGRAITRTKPTKVRAVDLETTLLALAGYFLQRTVAYVFLEQLCEGHLRSPCVVRLRTP